MKFTLTQTDELIVGHSGLAIVGQLLNKIDIRSRLDNVIIEKNKKPQIKNSDVVASYIGLLCQGKNDFEYIEQFRNDDFFHYAMDIRKIPSCSLLRQRFDNAGDGFNKIIKEESAKLLRKYEVQLSPCYNEYIAVDIDVSPFDNSNTKKEGVSRTYKGTDGYAPIFAYIGQEGYCINTELREGKRHSQCESTKSFLENTIKYAKEITDKPLLVRMDSGNDSIENIAIFQEDETKTDYIIKRNPRKEKPEIWFECIKNKGRKLETREGKSTYISSIKLTNKKLKFDARTVVMVTERTTKANGQILLLPEYELSSYNTSLMDVDEETIIALYKDHGTSEQFHSELKTDLDLERLPSGYFKTNDLVLHLGIFAYNILRLIGQESLNQKNAPVRKKVLRRRVKTVIQNLITMASRLVKHARKYYLKFSKQNAWYDNFNLVYYAVCAY